MNIYLVISAIVFILLGTWWNKSNLLNLFVKVILIILGIIGIIYTLEAYNYIFKIH
jgi:hypothetical protein